MLEPLCILDYKWVKRGTKLYTEALVQWKNMAAEDATWEDVEQLQQQFPAINLGDKVPLQGGASDGKPRKSPRKPQPNPKYLAILGDKNNKSPVGVQEELLQKS